MTNGGCTSQLDPALGGGFGRYKDSFGLVLDNMVDMTVVLANGTVAHVSSTSNPDLYWGVKGAGPNLGIVTEANFKNYDFPSPRWFHAGFTFAALQLESLFEYINDLDHPSELVIMLLQFDYAGSLEEAQPYFEYFNDLHPVAVRKWESLSPTEIQPAEGQNVYGLYKQLITEHPDFNRSVRQFESYARQDAKAVDPDSTAYANRDDDILLSLASLSAFRAIGREYGSKAWAIWHAGDTPGRNVTAYLNHANGDETLETADSYESWCLERLRALKKQYDPENRFCFYKPIQGKWSRSWALGFYW
ncbi:MAG: hypothetical protein Q9204_001953 [Flavoplaca sp. TL-2023a]